jgi:unsaturated rhamnogalacturonyl hydrolase
MVDPDTEKETTKPNFIEAEHIKTIAEFVKNGGVLVIMANDSGNVEFTHLNKLTETFGIHLNGDSKSKVYNDKYEMAAFFIPAKDSIFTTAKKVYLKEVSSLQLYNNAIPILKHQTENYVVGAKAKFGKGTVVVIGDPWFYNEYINGRLGYTNGWDNDKAANDFVAWLWKLSK